MLYYLNRIQAVLHSQTDSEKKIHCHQHYGRVVILKVFNFKQKLRKFFSVTTDVLKHYCITKCIYRYISVQKLFTLAFLLYSYCNYKMPYCC